MKHEIYFFLSLFILCILFISLGEATERVVVAEEITATW